MKENFLKDFEEEIKIINLYLQHIENVDSLVIKNKFIKSQTFNSFEKHMRQFNLSKKLFEYKSIVITLYGLIENTISQWIQEHVQNISIIVNNFSDLTESFQNQHFSQSIKLIANINDNKYLKFNNIDKKDILKKLNSTIFTPTDFLLNPEAYIPISGNLKHSKIIEAFKPLEIEFDAKLNSYKNKIDELVSRRNDIAHGEKIDDILDISMYSDYIDSLKAYMTIIFETINEKELEYESLFSYIKIEKIYNIYNNSILCFQLEDNKINVDDTVIVKSAKNDFFIKKVLDIHINKKSVQYVNAIDKVRDISVNLEKNIKCNQTFFIKRKKDK